MSNANLQDRAAGAIMGAFIGEDVYKRQGRFDQRARRADALVGDQGDSGAARYHHCRHGVGDLRSRRSRLVYENDPASGARREGRTWFVVRAGAGKTRASFGWRSAWIDYRKVSF